MITQEATGTILALLTLAILISIILRKFHKKSKEKSSWKLPA